MSDPIKVVDGLDRATDALDTLSKDLDEATEELIQSEEEWDKVYDEVGESLKEDMVREGRQGDPAAHTILSAARKEHRSIYQRWRRAKRKLENLERKSSNRRSELSGYQSQIKVLEAEGRADYSDERRDQLKRDMRRRAA